MFGDWGIGSMDESREFTAETPRRRGGRRASRELLAAAFCVTFIFAQGSTERQLEAAIYREVVAGDLKGAIENYRAIVGQKDAPRSVAATALLHMGECYEKLGQRRQAHESYLRVVREFESESAVAADARARIRPAVLAILWRRGLVGHRAE